MHVDFRMYVCSMLLILWVPFLCSYLFVQPIPLNMLPLCRLVSGDFFEHFCFMPGCCKGHSIFVCAARFAKLCLVILQSLGSDLPSIVRWYTFLPHLGRQSLGMLLHKMLPRVATEMFSGTSDGDEDNSYHIQMNQKKRTALEHLTSGTDTILRMAQPLSSYTCSVVYQHPFCILPLASCVSCVWTLVDIFNVKHVSKRLCCCK
jgi:hypothetical protein